MIDSLCAGVPAISPHSGADAAGPGVGIHYTLGPVILGDSSSS